MTDFVPSNSQLRHPRLSACSLDLDGLRQIVADDAKKRYDLKFEPDTLGAGSSSLSELDDFQGRPSLDGLWWIKANQGHSMKVQGSILNTSPFEPHPLA
jgi:2'-phosphotransferase